jgi:hypothetical protein
MDVLRLGSLIDTKAIKQDIYALDLTLWSMLSTLARQKPSQAAAQFSLSARTLETLASAPRKRLKTLASGAILSFQLATPEQAIIAKLSRPYRGEVFSRRKADQWGAAYWLLFNRLASKDTEIAKEVFGASRTLSQAVAVASDHQLRHLANTIVVSFTLRCAPTLIEEILNAHPTTTCAMLKKLQQSLCA